MGEKLPKNEIFTQKQLKDIADGAEASKRAESKRAGDYVEYAGPGPEEFEKLPKGTAGERSAQTIRSRPESSAREKKERPKDWYRRSEEKLEKLNDRGPRLGT